MKAAPLVLVLLLATPAAAQPRPDIQTQVAPAATPFLGGVPTGTATREVVTLTVLDAIMRALEHNLGVLLAEQDVGRARGVALDDAQRAAAERQRARHRNAAEDQPRGVRLRSCGARRSPASRPSSARSTCSTRACSLSQSVVDLARAQRRARRGAQRRGGATTRRKSARDLVIHVAGNLYVQALAASARADAARAQQQTAQALYQPGARPEAERHRRRASTCCAPKCSSSTETPARHGRRATSSRRRSCSSRASSACRSASVHARSDAAGPADARPDARGGASSAPIKTRPDYQAALERVQRRRSHARSRSSAKRCRRCRSTPTTATIGLSAERRAGHLRGHRRASTSRSSRAAARGPAARSRRRPPAAAAPRPRI